MMRTEKAETSAGQIVLRLLCIAVMAAAWWTLAGQPAHAAGDFIIKDYDIQMQVNEDDTYTITETLNVRFTAPSHGIYRVIPTKTVLFRDDQQSRFYGKVKDFQMISGQPVDKKKGDDAWYFRIGDPDRYADEDTVYKYSYVFDMRGDHLKGADEVYYNMIGTSWETPAIEHVTFRVAFPKDIDMNRVGIKTGYDVAVPFTSDGRRVIRGKTTENVLGGLTIRAVLPEGYFTRQAFGSGLLLYLLAAALLAVTGAGFMLWRKYGRDPQLVETEEFYPPERLTPAEVAYLDEGEIAPNQITSLLLSLANKGYLKIVENVTVQGRKKNNINSEYEIVRLKEYDGDSEDERVFMDGLFDGGNRETVNRKDLKGSFYQTLNTIKTEIRHRYAGQLYDKKAADISSGLRLIGMIGMIALFVISKLLNGSPFIVNNGDFLIYCVFAVMEIALPVIGFWGLADWINKPRKKMLSMILGFVGWGLMILIGLGLAAIFDTCMGSQIPAYILGMAAVFLLNLMAALCEKRTEKYSEILGKIRGYKRFLKVAEKDRMEMLAEQDPDYYYKNLAFAFALGVTAVYAKRFASLASRPPEWYDSPAMYTTGSAFNAMHMTDSMNSMMSSVSRSMVSSPSSSGSGGGGSFSGGGGAGGGGGGSW